MRPWRGGLPHSDAKGLSRNTIPMGMDAPYRMPFPIGTAGSAEIQAFSVRLIDPESGRRIIVADPSIQ